MAETTLEYERREKTGTRTSKRLRRNGLVPAVIYGEGAPAVPISVDHKVLWDILHHRGRNTIVSLRLGEDRGEDAQTTIIKDLQQHPIRRDILHVDFHRISLTEKIVVEVSVEAVGSPVGVRETGGVLERMLQRVEVECLPGEIPDRIDIDVASMNIGDATHVSDLVLEGDTRVITDGDRSVFVVVPPTVAVELEEEEVEAEAEAVEAEAQQPEVIERGRKDESEAGGESQ